MEPTTGVNQRRLWKAECFAERLECGYAVCLSCVGFVFPAVNVQPKCFDRQHIVSRSRLVSLVLCTAEIRIVVLSQQVSDFFFNFFKFPNKYLFGQPSLFQTYNAVPPLWGKHC